MTIGFLFTRVVEDIEAVAASFQMPCKDLQEFIEENLPKLVDTIGQDDFIDKNLMLRLVKLHDGHVLLQRLRKSRGCKGHSIDNSVNWWTVIVLEDPYCHEKPNPPHAGRKRLETFSSAKVFPTPVEAAAKPW